MRPVPIQPSIAARSDIAFSLPARHLPTDRPGQAMVRPGSAAEARAGSCGIAYPRDRGYSRSQPQIVVSAIRVAASSLTIADHAAGATAGALRWPASQRARSTTACP